MSVLDATYSAPIQVQQPTLGFDNFLLQNSNGVDMGGYAALQQNGNYVIPNQVNTTALQQAQSFNNLSGGNPAVTPWWQSSDNWNTIGKGVGAVAGAANVYLGFEQLGIAKDQLALQKRVTNTQLANLAEDRARASTMRSTASTTA